MINNKYCVIDSHCHIYPDKIAEKATAGTDDFYGLKSACKGTCGELIARGKKAGIDKFVVESVATTPKQVGSINRFIAGEVSKNEDIFIGLGTLHPDSDDIKGDIDELLGLGIKGVKLHPDIQGFKIDDYRCLKIYEICEEKGLPILFHAGDNRYDFSNPNRLKPILEIYTGLTVIAAHLGGYSVWDEAVKTLEGIPNLYVDTSSSFLWLDNEKVMEIIKRYGTDKVLFGSDYPMWKPESELERFLTLPLTEEEKRKILFDNCAGIYGIKKPDFSCG